MTISTASLPAASLPAADPVDWDDACGKGMNLQLAGRTDLAEQIYRSILQAAPSHAATNYCLGMLKVQLRQPAQAVPFLMTALNQHPEIPDYWLGYLEALLLAGSVSEAAEALALGREHGLEGTAVEEFARRLDARLPTAVAAPTAIAAPTSESAHASESAHSPKPMRSSRRVNPRDERRQFEALRALIAQQRIPDALLTARTFTKVFPKNGSGWKTLGALLWWTGNHDEALGPMRHAARLLPRDAESHSNLGMALMHAKHADEAVRNFERAIRLDGNFAAAHYHLGMALFRQDRYAEAQASLGKAVVLKPEYLTAEVEPCHSVLLFLYNHDASMDADTLFGEHKRFGRLIEDPLRATHPQHSNLRDPERRLRIGFVSGDLRNHAIASFLEPVLQRLNTYAGIELHAYYNETVEDQVTARLRAHFKRWNAVALLSDPALADLIRDQGIDILIDLSGPTGLNRLRVFARKPAPVQVSWMGYPGTTGLRAMDYYLADRFWLPPAQFDRQFIEKLIFLPAVAIFRPEASAPQVGSLPALTAGHMTFGSFNRLGKINAATIDLWSHLLRALPASRLMLAGIPHDGQHAQLIARFAAQGVAPGRITTHPRGGMETYLALHAEVDICLDTVPYNGGTTTHHALWMGVPTLTVAGGTPAARQGAGILGLAGLDGFIAADADDFVAKGVRWATELDALAQLRAGMRERCAASLSQRPSVLVTALEHALRRVWRRWCANLPAESFEVPAAAEGSAAREAPAQPQDAALLALIEHRRFDEARARASDMTQQFPGHGLGWKILGAMLWAAGDGTDALAAMRTAARLLPDDAETHSNLGMILAKLSLFDEADSCLEKSIEIDPGFAPARYRQGMSYELQGRYAEAEASLRSAIALRSSSLTTDDEQGYSNLLYLLSYNPKIDADALFDEHRRVGEVFEADSKAHWPRHRNNTDPGRRLQVGLVSGDLRQHAMASFLEPILSNLCREANLDLHAYSNCGREDHVTTRLRGYVKHWNSIAEVPDAALAKKIVDDGIDILIDLSGHTGLNRLRTFARKPAPVQVSWMGYPGTTGLRSMDYYLTDRHWLPAEEFSRQFVEKLAYLSAVTSFQPEASAPPVAALPALTAGRITFGSFNRPGKINTATISLWSKLLRALPTSGMMLAGISAGGHHTRLLKAFAEEGIAPERLMFHPRSGMDEYLALHHQVDICLDTFPYGGGTTTHHALWMGVPTLTVAGRTPAARQAAGIMGLAGLQDFIAADGADFVAKGLLQAAHPAALADLRAGLRERCRQSPSHRPDVIAAGLRRALERMWKRWCAGLPAESFEVGTGDT